MEQSTSQVPMAERGVVHARQLEQLATLPSELLYHIVRLAASTDYKTAHSCALVSKAICAWTRADRWKTIVITNCRQLEALSELILATSEKTLTSVQRSRNMLWARDTQRARDKETLNLDDILTAPSISPSGVSFTSLPSIQPGWFVENLFIETQEEHASRVLDTNDSDPSQDSVPSTRRQLEADAAEPARQSVKLDYCRQWRQLQACGIWPEILQHFPHVNYLAIGNLELSFFKESLYYVSPRKFLFTLDHTTESVIDACMTTSHEAHWRRCELARRADAGDAHDPCPFWIPCLGGLRRRLISMHVIGIDPMAERSGIPVPCDVLEPLRSGSTARGSMLMNTVQLVDLNAPTQIPLRKMQCSTGTSIDVAYTRPRPSFVSKPVENLIGYQNFWQLRAQPKDDFSTSTHPADNPYGAISRSFVLEASQGLISLRYDTRKFSLRPCEITASRLKNFFREIVATPYEDLNQASSSVRSVLPSFSHSGPRHAAPLRGSGNFVVPNKGDVVNNSSREQNLLNLCGSKQFKKLQICWDPRPISTDAASVDEATQKASNRRKAQTDDDSSWPLERQDIWTNTSSHNNEARAPPPHQPNTKAQNRNGWKESTRSGSSREESAEPLSRWRVKPQDRTSDSKSFRADLVDAIRTTLGWTAHDQALLSSSLPRLRFEDEDEDEELEDHPRSSYQWFLKELVERSITHHPGLDEKGEQVVPDSIPTVNEVKLELRPPIEVLKLGEHYVPYTKAERVEWFLANLDTDEA